VHDNQVARALFSRLQHHQPNLQHRSGQCFCNGTVTSILPSHHPSASNVKDNLTTPGPVCAMLLVRGQRRFFISLFA
jgi:hypothetical protein